MESHKEVNHLPPRSDHHIRLFDRLGFGLKYPSKVDASRHILIKFFIRAGMSTAVYDHAPKSEGAQLPATFVQS